ncbi:MAG: hypothetical protein JXA71_16720 [Chitinispirillaceae bacterium]|nr:hypothetical protein [Chitinispirillaceae bacterium]
MITHATRGNASRSAGVFLVLLLSFALSTLFARPVGKFSYRGAPEGKNNDSIIVSDTIVAMSEKIFVTNTFYSDSILDTPAICFIIDHSTSMSTAAGRNDQQGNRFRVTSALIDTIYNRFPTAEIGYVVFKNGLFYRYTDYTNFFGQYAGANNDGYMALKKLNQVYGTELGVNVLKHFLLTRDSTINSITYTELLYTPTPWPTEGTNITLAFEAGKAVLNLSQKSDNNKYIIFLSDGEHTSGGDNYVQGTGCPTTFTIYFTSTGSAPTTLVNMTNNIRRTYPKSSIWPFTVTDFSSLMTFVRDSIYSAIVRQRPAFPASLTVGTQTISTWSATDSTFAFGSLFPLIGQTTPFNYIIKYPRPAPLGDTIHTVGFNVKTQQGFRRAARDSLVYWLWDREVEFQSVAGATLTNVTRENDEIQLRFDFSPGDADYSYSAGRVSIELVNTSTTVRDREVINLTKGTGNFFTGRIRRVVASSASIGNNVLEHLGSNDTLIATFRNNETPKLPLDTLQSRIALRITPNAQIVTAATKDNDGNGFIDAINLTFNFDTSWTTASSIAGFSVTQGSNVLNVRGIERTPGGTIRQWRLMIDEPATQENVPLQTSWTPTIMANNALLPRVDNQTIVAIDSCAPVVYKVKKYISDQNDRKKDTVKVTFSEKIFNPTTQARFVLTNTPAQTFRVWWGNTTVPADTLLADIPGFVGIIADSILVFTMANGKDLTDKNWMNINAASLLLADRIGNTPRTENRKVKVEIETITIIKTFPNPAIATIKTIDNNGKNVDVEIVVPGGPEKIKTTVITEKKGAIISIGGIKIPTEGMVNLTMKIYDVAGNSVNWIKKDDVFKSSTPLPAGTRLDLYWNGLNNKGMRSAPGVYRAVVYLDYPALSKIKDIRTISMIGIQQ